MAAEVIPLVEFLSRYLTFGRLQVSGIPWRRF